MFCRWVEAPGQHEWVWYPDFFVCFVGGKFEPSYASNGCGRPMRSTDRGFELEQALNQAQGMKTIRPHAIYLTHVKIHGGWKSPVPNATARKGGCPYFSNHPF